MAQYEAMIGYNVHSTESKGMGNWSKLNRDGSLNREQRNKVGILHKYRSEYERSALNTQTILSETFRKEKCFFPFLSVFVGKCK